jgi:GTPase SAR1 family protein
MRPLAYHRASAVLLCFALDSNQSFVSLTERWIPELRRFAQNSKIILVGTKSDLHQSANPNCVTDDETQRFLAEQNGDAFIRCSAMSEEGVAQVFPAVVKACRVAERYLIL